MKIFVNRSMLDVHDKPIKDGNKEADPDSKLGAFMVEALLRDLDIDKSDQRGLKEKRFILARKITRTMKASQDLDRYIDMPSGDVDMVKMRFERFAPTPLFGPFVEALEDTEAATA